MKKLIVALMLISLSVVSCGKTNSTNSGASTSVNPITNTAVQGASQLGSMIDNYQSYFGSTMANYYMTYGQLANQGVNLKYLYTKSTASNSNNCSLKWGIFYICSYASSSTSTSNLTASKSVMNNEVNIVNKQNELKGYINNAYMITQSSSTAYLIYLKDGRKIIIDLAIPLQAQPSAVQDNAGVSEYLYQITQ